jgi:hypothetical protein
MTTDDREILVDIRHRLHGLAMALGQLNDQAFAREVEGNLDGVIAKISRKLGRKRNANQED